MTLPPRARTAALGLLCLSACTSASRHDSATGPSQRLEVRHPQYADEPLLIRDPLSRIELSARLLDARASHAEKRGDLVVYRDVFPGSELRHRETARGVEDLISFTTAPAVAVVTYALELGSQVHALRLVENTLEVLDDGGAPRLRVLPPFVTDHFDKRHSAELSVEGCAIDTNPAPPWHRAVTPLDARHCSLHVTWNNRIAYPAVLDPQWSVSESMAVARTDHIAVSVVGSNAVMVLVAGGVTYDLLNPGYQTVTASAELYDAASRTWSTTGSMSTPRFSFPASALGNGSVLVAGGRNYDLQNNLNIILQSAEIYDATSGTWSLTQDSTGAATQMMEARTTHTLTALADGRVLVTGGYAASDAFSSTAEIFDPSLGTWTYTTSGSGTQTTLSTPRAGHTATLLPNSTVLLAGGYSGTDYSSSAELFVPATGGFTPTGSMVSASNGHTATLIGSSVLVVGGSFGKQSELYDVAAGSWRATTGALQHSRGAHTATLLAPGGPVLVAGGDGENDPVFQSYQPLDTAELYVPAIDRWFYTDDMPDRLSDHAAAALGDGRVLITGGEDFYTDRGGAIVDSAWEFDKLLCTTDFDCTTGQVCSAQGICQRDNGQNCEFPTQCVSGNCARSVSGLECSACPTCQELDSSGTCVIVPVGTACARPYCYSNAEVSHACDAAGACKGTSVGCSGGFTCDQRNAACLTSCTRYGECQSGFVCDVQNGICVTARADGAACDDVWQCQPGHYCAVTESGGFCAQCDTCQALDSTGYNCLYAPGTLCGQSDCASGVQTQHVCDSVGACNPTSAPCSRGLSCDSSSAGTCLTTCATDGDCQTGLMCDVASGTCAMPVTDAGTTDSGTPDAGSRDSGTTDARAIDAGNRDAAATPDSGGRRDASTSDAAADARGLDATSLDDAGAADAHVPSDAERAPDAVVSNDSGLEIDAPGAPDNQRVAGGGCGCEVGKPPGTAGWAWAIVVAGCAVALRRARGNS